EATTSFSAGYHAAVHVRLTPEILDLFTLMQATKETVPFARRLGYRAILWGPVERAVWGESVGKRFLGDKLAEAGGVALYELRDRWPHAGETPFRLGKRLMDAGWRAEALQAFGSS